MDRYQVTAGYVTVETSVGEGSRARIDIPRGADLPDDVSDAEREALLRRGDVELVDDRAAAELAAAIRAALDGVGVVLDGVKVGQLQGAEQVIDPDAVPEGTIQVVMDWVAGDKDRAQRALDAEQAASQPRSTLIAELQKLAAGE